jgi:hypothetical protein
VTGDRSACSIPASVSKSIDCLLGYGPAGSELLVAGPTAWGTELQLPDSWVEAIQAAQLPEEQPLMQPLEVRLCSGLHKA